MRSIIVAAVLHSVHSFTPLFEKYPWGPGEVVPRWEIPELTSTLKGKKRPLLKSSQRIFANRTPTNCTYPLEVIILQDVTGSFYDDFPNMINTELPDMYNSLSETHPGSTFGVVSFSDKPILPFGYPHEDGYRDDYCYLLDAPLGANLTQLNNTYTNYIASGGGDAPENQYGVMFDAIQAKQIGWGSTANAVRLLVLSTDSPPHYDDDNGGADRHNMSKFSGVFNESDINGQCVSEFYPSWQETIAQVVSPTDGSLPPYVAFLIFDSSPSQGVIATWEWFASQIFENNSFVQQRNEDSTNFWESLADIIGVIDSTECNPVLTTTPPPTTTSSPSTTVTETLPTLTTTESVQTSQTLPSSTSSVSETATTSTVLTTNASCQSCNTCATGNCSCAEDPCNNKAAAKYPKDVVDFKLNVKYLRQ